MLNVELLYDPGISLLAVYPREIKTCDHKNNLYTNIYSCIIQNSQKVKQLKYQSTEEWINKMWYTHTIGYYLYI